MVIRRQGYHGKAILHVDNQTHRLTIVHGPEVWSHGFSPVVGSVALVPGVSEAWPDLTQGMPPNTEQKQQGMLPNTGNAPKQ